MAEVSTQTDNNSGSTGSASGGGSDAPVETNDTNDEPVVKPEATPVTSNGNGSQNGSQSEAETDKEKSRSLSEKQPEKMAAKEPEQDSLTTALNHARQQGISLGIKDPDALENFTASVANKNLRGDPVNLISEVQKFAGPMAAAVAQANMELNLTTKIAMGDHGNVGSGLYAGKQQQRETSFSTVA